MSKSRSARNSRGSNPTTVLSTPVLSEVQKDVSPELEVQLSPKRLSGELMTTKRKRIKKSHGPDFVENYDAYFEQATPKQSKVAPLAKEAPIAAKVQDLKAPPFVQCSVCSRFLGKKPVPYSVLKCERCKISVHTKCMNYTATLARAASSGPWQCIDCKECALCVGNDDSVTDTMLVCDYCDKGYHMRCHRPVVTSKPKGKWRCCKCIERRANCAPLVTKQQQQSPAASKRPSVDSSVRKAIAESSRRTLEAVINDRRITNSENEKNKRHGVYMQAKGVESESSSSPGSPSDSSADSSSQSSQSDNGATKHDDEPRRKRIAQEIKQTISTFKLQFNKSSVSDGNRSSHSNSMDSDFSNAAKGTRIPTVYPKVIPDASGWTIDDVKGYFDGVGLGEWAIAFKEQEIDGRSLLLMKRSDVLTGMSIKLGPALKIYNHIKRLQTSKAEVHVPLT